MTTQLNWTGASGNVYTFSVHPLGTQFNPIPGIYLFCRDIPDGLEALYVGETQSFVDRLNTGLQNHDGYKRASRIGFDYVAVMRCDDSTERLRIETDLRHAFNPIFNRRSVENTR